MAHSYISSLYHCIFSTKERRRIITPDIESNLWEYMVGIARKNKMKVLQIGGIEDHVHLLLSLPSTLSVAKALQLIKGGSSKWVHENFPDKSLFSWQEGYGAFSIGINDVERTIDYIKNQREHHKRFNFKQEFVAF